MSTDKIIVEWFYRLPKGYAMEPYTEAELAVLQEVLTEFNITVDREPTDTTVEEIAKDDSTVIAESLIYEQLIEEDEPPSNTLLTEGYTKDDLINVIRDTTLPDKLISYISRLIDSATAQTSVIKSLEGRRFDSKTSRMLFDKAVEFDSYQELQSLVTSDATGIPYEDLGVEGNLQTFIDKVGFSNEYADWLYNYRPAVGGVNVGAGENMLRVILRGGHVPSKGDVGAGNIEIELKSTQTKRSGFRMRGQSGYGIGYDVAQKIFQHIETAYGSNLPSGFIDYKSGSNLMQLYYKSGKESLSDEYFKDLVGSKKLTADNVRTLYADAFNGMYKGYSGDLKAEVFNDSIRNDGTIDASKLLPRLAAIEFRYYADAEPWDSFMVLNHQKDYLIINKDSSFNELVDIFESKFNIDAGNTKPKATAQDSVVGVQLKAM